MCLGLYLEMGQAKLGAAKCGSFGRTKVLASKYIEMVWKSLGRNSRFVSKFVRKIGHFIMQYSPCKYIVYLVNIIYIQI